MADPKCTGEHSIHICTLAKEQKYDEIKKLTKKPTSICYACGRVATDKKNLCNPQGMTS